MKCLNGCAWYFFHHLRIKLPKDTRGVQTDRDGARERPDAQNQNADERPQQLRYGPEEVQNQARSPIQAEAQGTLVNAMVSGGVFVQKHDGGGRGYREQRT